MSKAKSIEQASAVKIELSIGRGFVFIILFKTDVGVPSKPSQY